MRDKTNSNPFPGLIWGFAFRGDQILPVSDSGVTCQGETFRWLHFTLSDQRAHALISGISALPQAARELLLSHDEHQRVLVTDGFVACVLHDFIRDFEPGGDLQLGALHCVLGPSLMITGRYHPVCCADIVRKKIEGGISAANASVALDLLASAIIMVASETRNNIRQAVQSIEDTLLEDRIEPDARAIGTIRRQIVQMQRQASGLRLVFNRLEEDEDLPSALTATVSKVVQRFVGLEGDIDAVQSHTRLLREELDMQTARRTNQNLYLLSIMTALLLPATFVTGIFGMNTGNLWLTHSSYGTFWATSIALSSAFGVYLALRLAGFFRGGSSG